MRYLNTRDVFLKNFKALQLDIHKEALLSYDKDEMVVEAFENDITWGGSLLGRFINSVIRKAKIQYNFFRVKSIARKIEEELNNLIFDGLSDDDKKAAKEVVAYYLLAEIYKSANDDKKSDGDKIIELLGEESKNEGLIKAAEDWIKTLDDDSKISNIDKATLLTNLDSFRNGLKDLQKYYKDREEFIDTTISLLTETKEIYDTYALTTSAATASVATASAPTASSATASTSSTGLKLIEGNYYKYKTTSTPSKIYLAKLENTKHPILSDGTVDTTKNLNTGRVIVRLQDVEGDKYTGKLKNTYLNVSVSQLEELANQPSTSAPPASPPKKRLTKDDVSTNDTYYCDVKGKKTLIKVLSKNFEVNINTNKATTRLADKDSVYIAELDKKGNLINPRPIKATLLYEKKLLSNFDNFFNYIFEASKMQSDVDNAENDIKDAIKTLDLDKLNELLDDSTKNSDKNYIAKFGAQLKDIGTKDPDIEDPIYDIAKIIVDIYQVIEPLEDDLIQDLKGNISKFKEYYTKIQETSLDKTGSVEEVWDDVWGTEVFNLSDNEKNKAIETRDRLENSKWEANLYDGDGRDRLIKIVELFGKAYSCFATELIPSGRPGGRISNKTRNEYVYIGGGNEPTMSETSGPGTGPWASKKVFSKFSEEITRLISLEKFRKVLVNGAIKSTNSNGEVKILKGNVLLEFMRNMTDENDLKNYDSNRTKFLNKYFDLDVTVPTASASGGETTVSKVDEGDRLMWSTLGKLENNTAPVNSFIVIDFKMKEDGSNTEKSHEMMGEVLLIKDNKMLIKFAIDDIGIPQTYGGYQLLKDESNLGHKYDPKRKIFYGLFELPLSENKFANMALILATKPNELKSMTMLVQKPGGKTIRGTTAQRPGIGLLKKLDKDRNEETLINKNPGTVNDTALRQDVKLDVNDTFNSLESVLSKMTNPIGSTGRGDYVKPLEKNTF